MINNNRGFYFDDDGMGYDHYHIDFRTRENQIKDAAIYGVVTLVGLTATAALIASLITASPIALIICIAASALAFLALCIVAICSRESVERRATVLLSLICPQVAIPYMITFVIAKSIRAIIIAIGACITGNYN